MEINNYIFFTISGLIFLIMLLIIFFSKERLKSFENNIYICLMFCTLLGIINELVLVYFVSFLSKSIILSDLTSKLFLILIESWVFLLCIYTITAVNNLIKKKQKDQIKELRIYFIIYILFVIITFILPIYYAYNNAHTSWLYTYGPSTKMVFVFSIVFIGISLFYIIKQNKFKYKKFIPIYVYSLMSIFTAFLQQISPSILMVNFAETTIMFLMYFTIENPDMKMIKQLEIARDQADKANRAKSDFLSSMSHEIRTPLNAITGFSECIESSKTLEEAKENASDIISAANTLLETVNGILDISKIEAGKIEIIESVYDPIILFNECAKLVKPRMDPKGLELRIKFAPDIPKSLKGDHINVKKAIINILTNAAKYTDKGYVSFTVNCMNKQNSTTLIIVVEDTGRGIKKESIDKLFTKFERLDESQNTTIEGTGLGLAITKQIVSLLGGKILVQSVYKCGSKFTLIIPQKINHDLKIEAINAIAKEESITNITNKNILVVDDNKLNLKVATKLIEPYGVKIITCESGFDCIELIKKKEPIDLILMDDMMPKMSGVETLKELKKIDGFSIPTIALTANAISGMKEKYLSDGFDDYLAKPIERPELTKVLNKFLK